MAKTTTLDAIPLAQADIDLNGIKVRNSGTITIGDIGGVGTGNTLATLQWVESRGGVYRDQAKTYADGQDITNFSILDGKISLVDSKKVNYTNGIDSLSYSRGDYNMGLFNIYNMASATQPDQAPRYDQLTTIRDNTYNKAQTDLLIASRWSYADGLANANNITALQENKADKATTYTKTEANTLLATKTNTSTTTALTNRVVDVEGSAALNATNIQTLSNDLSANYNTKTQDTALFKPIAQIESKIKNSTEKTAISCDSDRYISIKSNNNKICDILEDEINAGFTLNTYNKRLNLVSDQPQTQYHNST